MTDSDRTFLITLSESIQKQLELQKTLIERLLKEDPYLTLEEVKALIPGVTTHRLNDLARRGILITKKTSPRTTLYLMSSLKLFFPELTL